MDRLVVGRGVELGVLGLQFPLETGVEAVGHGAEQAPDVTQPQVPVPSAILDSPYEPAAVTAVGVAPARAAIAPVAPAPEAAEGELWALVGASEPTAKPAPASEATRVIVTILTAFLIIVILVGSLVLASQIA